MTMPSYGRRMNPADILTHAMAEVVSFLGFEVSQLSGGAATVPQLPQKFTLLIGYLPHPCYYSTRDQQRRP